MRVDGGSGRLVPSEVEVSEIDEGDGRNRDVGLFSSFSQLVKSAVTIYILLLVVLRGESRRTSRISEK